MAKLLRAKEHADALSMELTTHRETIEVTVEGQRDWKFVRAVLAEPATADVRWSAILGDALHNLRSALDHLVWGLTVLGSGKTGDWTQFPILMNEGDIHQWRTRKTLEQLSDPQRGLILSIQPYHWGRPSAQDHPLARIGRLDNDDKHKELAGILRLPTAVEFTAESRGDCDIISTQPNMGVVLDIDAVIGTVEIHPTGDHPKVYMKAVFAPDVELIDPLKISPLDLFAELSAFVILEIVRPLAPDLVEFVRIGDEPVGRES